MAIRLSRLQEGEAGKGFFKATRISIVMEGDAGIDFSTRLYH